MNERIREIAKQASEAVAGSGFTMTKYEEKFAELIVIECMNIVGKAGNSKAEILWNLEELIWSNK